MAFTDLLNKLGVSPDTVLSDDQQEKANTAAVDGVGTVGAPQPLPGEQFPNNPVLTGANTANGGVFANLPGGELAAIKEGTKMSDFPTGPLGGGDHVMLITYLNTTEDSIDIEIESEGFGASAQTLGAGAYDQTSFAEVGSGAPWVRIPTGIGTPQPSDPGAGETAYDEDGNFVGGGPVTHDYKLKEVTETDSGFKVVWEQLEEITAQE